MNTMELDSDPILVTLREWDEENDLILVPTRRMTNLLARAVRDAIPSIACPDEAEEARNMLHFLDGYLEKAA